MTTAYTHRFSVYGVLAFPIDMLRYDKCCPISETDSTAILRSIVNSNMNVEHIIVNLQVINTLKDWVPTRSRWYSFGWQVLTPVVRNKSNVA